MAHSSVFLSAALLVGAASVAAAQTSRVQLADLTLEELLDIRIVTARRTAESASRAPASVEVVTAEQIERRGYRSLLELLRDMPAIKVDVGVDQDLSADLTVQGTRGTSRLLILLDGVRITSPTSEALPLLANYPVHLAEQVEILYGPASALYGADAFSGVVNIITKKGPDATGARASTAMGQGGLTNTTASYGIPVGDGHVTVAGQLFYDRQPDLSRAYPADFGGLASHRDGTFDTILGPMTAGVAVSPEYRMPVRARNLHARVDHGRFDAWVFHSVERASNTPAYTPDNAVYNDIAFQQNELTVASASYRAPLGRADSTTTVTVSRHEMDPESGYLNVFSSMQRSYKYAYGSMARAAYDVDWKAARRVSLQAGTSFERLFSIPQTADLNAPLTDRRRPGTILGTDVVDELHRVKYHNLGAYAQAEWALHPALSLSAGLRGDYNTRYEPVLNPRVGVVSHLGGGTRMKLLYGTAYLAPSPYQSYLHYGSFYTTDEGATYESDFWHVPNPDLRPQHKSTVEAQVHQPIGSSFSVTVSMFRSRFTDLVLESDITAHTSGTYLGWPVAYLQQFVNGGHETTYGGTLTAELLHRFGAQRTLRVRASGTGVEGRTFMAGAPGGDIETGGISPFVGKVTADLDWGDWTFAPRLIGIGAQRALAIDVDDAGQWRRRTIDGYAVVDMTVQRRITRALQVFGTVDNLLDARYRNLNLRAFTNPEEMAGSPQNPRRMSVGVRLSFQ